MTDIPRCRMTPQYGPDVVQVGDRIGWGAPGSSADWSEAIAIYVDGEGVRVRYADDCTDFVLFGHIVELNRKTVLLGDKP